MAISYWMFAFRFTLILSSKDAQQKQQHKCMQVRRRSDQVGSIKLGAKEKMPSFYYESKDEDLVAWELKCYRSSYNKFRLSSVRFDDISDNAESRDYQEEGNYNSVTDYVTKHILNEKKAVSIAVLHTIYGLKSNDTRYCSKLKSRLKKRLPYPVFSEHWT